MPVAKPESSDSRIIAHVDMDCFYVQVEQRKQLHLRGLPTAVVQYNSWKGGCLIAVSYEARKCGVKRSMRGEEAKQVCPQIQLVQVPVAHGKADLNVYRNAGSEVVSILASRGRCERASIDEVYLDLTDAAESMLAQNPPESLEVINEEALKSNVLGLDKDGDDVKQSVREWLRQSDTDHRNKLLACGALIVAELRLQVLKETDFTCSAGIAHNKMLAKLASGMNKPAQQTVVPFSSVKGLLNSLPIKKMKQLGGKLGDSLQSDLGVNAVGDLLQFSEEKLQERYGINTGTWLWNIARGISGEEVQGRLLPKSHGSGKTFPGPRALKTIPCVQHWLNALCEELNERLLSDLDQNKRVAHMLTLHARAYKSTDTDSQKKFPSKSCPLRYGTSKIQEDALKLFQSGLREFLGSSKARIEGTHCAGWGITGLSVSASKIVAIPSGTSSIMKYFNSQHPDLFSADQSHKCILEAPASSHLGSAESVQRNPIELNMEATGDETILEDFMPCEDQLGLEKISGRGEGPVYFSSKPSLGELDQKSPSLPSSEQQVESPVEASRNKYTPRSLGQQEHRRNTTKCERTSSILRFFRSSNTHSSPNQDHGETVPDATPSSSGAGLEVASGSCSGIHQSEAPRENSCIEPGTSRASRISVQDGQGTERWGYKINEIDHSVIDELPPEIQQEVQAWLRPQKRANTAKRGSSIAQYFLPTKNTWDHPE